MGAGTTIIIEEDNAMFTTSRSGKAGSARMREIAVENKAEIEKITAHLIRGLKRPATPGEEIEAELVAAAVVKSRRLRDSGKNDASERRLLKQLMKETVFGSVPEQSPAERQHGPAVAEAYARHDDAARARSAREPWVAEESDPAADEAPVTDEAAAGTGERGP
jgi:hypothetical protein